MKHSSLICESEKDSQTALKHCRQTEYPTNFAKIDDFADFLKLQKILIGMFTEFYYKRPFPSENPKVLHIY